MEEKTKEKKRISDIIISWICIIWAVLSVGFMCYFSGIEQVTFSIMVFGQLFVIMGIISLVRKQFVGTILTITGFGCIVIPAINEWGYILNLNMKSSMIFPIMISTAIPIIGLAMMFGPGFFDKIASKKCKKEVEAYVFDFKTVELKDGKTAYLPIYQYSYAEKEYTKCMGKYTSSPKENVGDKKIIRINENKPEEVFIETSKASKMLIYIFGFCFFITGLGMLLTVLAEI